MWSNLGSPRVFRWGGQQQSSPAGQPKPQWTLIQGNLAQFIQRWGAATIASQPGSFGVAGVVSLTVTPSPIRGIRVTGEIHASFVAGGSITVAGGFTQTGAIIATYSISPVVGFRVDGEILARFYRRAGQQAECIAGSGEPASGSTPWNAAY